MHFLRPTKPHMLTDVVIPLELIRAYERTDKHYTTGQKVLAHNGSVPGSEHILRDLARSLLSSQDLNGL